MPGWLTLYTYNHFSYLGFLYLAGGTSETYPPSEFQIWQIWTWRGAWGEGNSIKSYKINKTHRVHPQQIEGRVFFWRFWAPQAAQHTRTLLGDPKTNKKISTSFKNQQKSIKPIRYMLQNSRACFFWGFWSAAGSASHTHPAGRPQNRQKHITN